MYSIYLVIGAFAGIMAGLFGIGGSVVVIPALSTLFLYHTMIPQAEVMQMAVGTSLAIMVITGTASLYAYQKHASIVWPVVQKMLPGLVIGACVGALLARFLPSSFLRILFAIFLILIGVRLLFNQKENASSNIPLPEKFTAVSTTIGALSSMLGIGGGTLIVPLLLRYQMDMHQATGTSTACGLAIGVVATIGFMLIGIVSAPHVPHSMGYIYWPAFLGVAFASAIFAPLGAKVVHMLPHLFLKRIFGIFLLIMATDMLLFG